MSRVMRLAAHEIAQPLIVGEFVVPKGAVPYMDFKVVSENVDRGSNPSSELKTDTTVTLWWSLIEKAGISQLLHC